METLTEVIKKYDNNGLSNKYYLNDGGKINGLYTRYYRNGKIMYACNCVNDKRNGIDTGYYDNGKIKAEEYSLFVYFKELEKNGFVTFK